MQAAVGQAHLWLKPRLNLTVADRLNQVELKLLYHPQIIAQLPGERLCAVAASVFCVLECCFGVSQNIQWFSDAITDCDMSDTGDDGNAPAFDCDGFLQRCPYARDDLICGFV